MTDACQHTHTYTHTHTSTFAGVHESHARISTTARMGTGCHGGIANDGDDATTDPTRQAGSGVAVPEVGGVA